MKHGSLFSGIGGFDLAAEWMGWENVFHCEINPFGQKILNYYWPDSISYEDITKTDFTIHRGSIDILTEGFPCQPFSLAGKRKGTEDERHLWPEMLRAIQQIQPRYVVGENVPGLVNWGGGMVFEQVQADLENEKYEVIPFILPAAGVNAPHKRERIWFVAYRDIEQRERKKGGLFTESINDSTNPGIESLQKGKDTIRGSEFIANTGLFRSEINEKQTAGVEQYSEGITPDTQKQRLQERNGEPTQYRSYTTTERHSSISNWQNFPTQPPVYSRNDGISCKLDGITFSKHRNESIKAYGNAIVPTVVFQIFKAIKQFEKETNIF
jgi:DNA (cytosine-5)-methyltransferase 1